jgi:hypothetical protein
MCDLSRRQRELYEDYMARGSTYAHLLYCHTFFLPPAYFTVETSNYYNLA